MYDKDFGGNYDYNEPSYDIGSDYYGDPQSNQSTSPFSNTPNEEMNLSKFKPLIFLGIVLLVIAAGVLFFINMQHTITFNIKEINGPSQYGLIEIQTLDGKQIYRNSNTSSEQITLWDGDYVLTVKKGGYEPYSKEIRIPDDIIEDSYTINLFKSLNASMNLSTNTISSIYGKKTIPGTITITNNGNETFQGELKVDSKDIEVLFPSENKNNYGITLPPGETTIIFSLGMTKAVTSSTNVKVDFIISGTNIKQTLNLEANPSPDISISKKELKNLKITAGSRITENIKIENKSNFIARDLKIEIVADPGKENMLNWFEFSPYAEENYKTEIDTLSKRRNSGDSQNLVLYVQPPITSQLNDDFTGRLILDSETLETQISIPIQYVINKILKSEVKLNASNKSPVTIRDAKTNATFTITNDGDLDVTNVTLKVNNPSVCDITWLLFLSDEDLDSQINIGDLPKKGTTGNSKIINIRLADGLTIEDSIDCQLVWEYQDPLNPTETISNDLWYIINYTPR
jgi:hypothetical protein